MMSIELAFKEPAVEPGRPTALISTPLTTAADVEAAPPEV
jgi:hypothetical protein